MPATKSKPMDPMTKTTTEEGVELDLPQSQIDSQVAAEHEKQLSTEPPVEAAPTPEPQVEHELEPERDPRQAKLEAIAKKSIDERTQHQPVVEPEPVTETEPEPEVEQEERAQRTYKIKVNGEEQEVTFEEMRTMAQKAAAADKKFQAAAEKEKSVDQRLKEFEDKLAQQSSVTPPNQDASQQQAVPQDRPMQFTPEVIDKALFDGDAGIRNEMSNRLNQRQMTTTEYEQIAEQKAQQQLQQWEFRNSVQTAEKSVSDADPIAKQMLSDSDMRARVNEYTKIVAGQDNTLSHAKIIERAVQHARLEFPELQSPEKQPEMQPAKQVATSKAAHVAGNVTRPTQRINVAPEPLTEAQSRQQAIAQQRRARGLVT